jgi:hypothetical protein
MEIHLAIRLSNPVSSHMEVVCEFRVAGTFPGSSCVSEEFDEVLASRFASGLSLAASVSVSGFAPILQPCLVLATCRAVYALELGAPTLTCLSVRDLCPSD